jgi:hypothetical protein
MDTLSTTVKDPKNPSEPWVVTTTRLPKESMIDFLKRHQKNVTAVKHFLKDV